VVLWVAVKLPGFTILCGWEVKKRGEWKPTPLIKPKPTAYEKKGNSKEEH
jgi:hypothetical protein